MKNVFIISGPAGSGKDAVIDGLSMILPIERIRTSTSRPIRPGESEGNPYYFLSRNEFQEKIARGDFIEYSTNENSELYGVTKEELERVERSARTAIWKIDWKGVMSAKRLYPNIKALFISAPIEILDARLQRRDGATHNEAYFLERHRYTEEWLKHTEIYDYIIENEEGKLDETIEKVRRVIEKEQAK